MAAVDRWVIMEALMANRTMDQCNKCLLISTEECHHNHPQMLLADRDPTEVAVPGECTGISFRDIRHFTRRKVCPHTQECNNHCIATAPE